MNGDINTGFDMWQDYKNQYGVITARITCLRYLDLQAQNKDESERAFCRELREAMTMERNYKDVGVYPYSEKLAVLRGITDRYNESVRLNRLCAGDIDEAIRACEYGDGTHDFNNGLGALIEQYGLDRVRFVLACEVRHDSVYGNYPDRLCIWAHDMIIHEEYGSFGVRTHPAVISEFISYMRETADKTREEGLAATDKTMIGRHYANGAEFWRDIAQVSVSQDAALQTGGNFIGAMIKHECSQYEKRLCRELFAAMYEDTAGTADKFMAVYPHDYHTAYDSGEDSLFTQSRERNESCATRIDYLINASQFKSQYYNLELAAMRAIHDYGFDRVNMVLARNIQARYSDGRFSSSNKQWARDVQFPGQAFESAILNAHPILIEDFTRYARKLYDEVGAERFTRREREENSEPNAAADDKPSVLKQIRDAQKNPPAPHGEKAPRHRKNKDGAEH